MRLKVLAAGLVLTGCLTGAQAADQLTLTELVVKPNLTAAGKRYDIALKYKGEATGVKQVCFLWSGEGPFCWANFAVDAGRKLIRTQAVTRNPNSYRLTGFVRYSGGNTNRVSKTIKVTR